MIIKRIYETYYDLAIRDEKSKNIIFKYLDCLPEGMSKQETLENEIRELIIYNSDIGSGIGDFVSMCNELDELDKKEPYDNGLTFRDVSEIITFPSRQGKACELVMFSSSSGKPRRIVQVIAVENEDGRNSVIDTWEFPRLI